MAHGSYIVNGSCGDAAFCCSVLDRLCQGVSRLCLHAGGERQQRLLADAVIRIYASDAETSGSQSAGLVEQHGVNAAHSVEICRAFDQHAMGRGFAQRHEVGEGHAYHHSAGAGADEQYQGAVEPSLPSELGGWYDGPCRCIQQHCCNKHCWRVPPRDAAYECLGMRFCFCRLLHGFQDARQRRVLEAAGCGQRCFAVYGDKSGLDGLAGGYGARHSLAGNCGRVKRYGVFALQHAVKGNPHTRFYADARPLGHVLGLHLGDAAVGIDHRHGFRHLVYQSAYVGASLLGRPVLQFLAEAVE